MQLTRVELRLWTYRPGGAPLHGVRSAAAAEVLGVAGAQVGVQTRLSVTDAPADGTCGGPGVHGQVLQQRFGVQERLPADKAAVHGPG